MQIKQSYKAMGVFLHQVMVQQDERALLDNQDLLVKRLKDGIQSFALFNTGSSQLTIVEEI